MPTDPTPAAPFGARSPVPSKIESPKSKIEQVRSYRLLLGLAALVLVLDQLTKAWISSRLPYGAYGHSGITVIKGFFNLVHVGNTGAAWSMFSGNSIVLALLAAATLIAIFFWRKALGLRAPLTQVCFGLLCGGILGNLLDRIRHSDGHVTDFIDLHFGTYVYPTFNVADAGICIGVILYLFHSLRNPKN